MTTPAQHEPREPVETGAPLPAEVWARLAAAASQVMERDYAPYSRFPVGAAALVDDGRIVTGTNVENASYGLGLCAECGLVSDLARTGGGRLVAFACVDGNGAKLVPCGRCRQLLLEFGGSDLQLDLPSGIKPLSAVLPEAFGPAHLQDNNMRGHHADRSS